MRTVTLPESGVVAKIGVKFVEVELTHKVGNVVFTGKTRGTEVLLTDTVNGGEVAADVICRPPDNFSKREGRRRVANALLRKLNDLGYSRNDRRMVFNAICPEFAQDYLDV